MEKRLLEFLEHKENFEMKLKLDEEVTRLLYTFQKELDLCLDSGKYQPKFLRSKLPGKVSKGNNHYGFPYQVLDYPAYISKEASFSFRASIWYGNYFSFSLILTGRYVESINIELQKLKDQSFFITSDDNIWETDFSKHKSASVDDLNILDFQTLIKHNNQLKIYRYFSLNQTSELIRLGMESFKSLLIR